MRRAIASLLVAIFALPFAGGCGIDYEYLVPVVFGQFDILTGSISIEEAIRRGELSDEEVDRLRLIQDVREYAGREMGLNTGDNYTLFYDAGEGPVVYNVSAAQRHQLVAKTWDFPIVGELPYMGFFDRGGAARKFNELLGRGYDVFMYEVDAYSTLEYLPNPILSPMLHRSELSLVETVIHELLHSTVWHLSDTTFNESLATFVGRTGALEYLAVRYPDEPERVQAATRHYEDTEIYNTFMSELYDQLEAFYSSDLSLQERIAGREAYYQAGRERFAAEYQPLMNDPDSYTWVTNMPTNNAWMLANYRYNYNLDLFEEVYDATGRAWDAAISVFHNAAGASDPNAYLRTWLAGDRAISPAALPTVGTSD